jgi:hypothetical protein
MAKPVGYELANCPGFGVPTSMNGTSPQFIVWQLSVSRTEIDLDDPAPEIVICLVSAPHQSWLTQLHVPVMGTEESFVVELVNCVCSAASWASNSLMRASNAASLLELRVGFVSAAAEIRAGSLLLVGVMSWTLGMSPRRGDAD